MKALTAIIVLVFGLSLNANADIWKWVDENGNVHYSDMPAHEYAKNAQVVRYSAGRRSASTSSDTRTNMSRGEEADSEKASQEDQEREDAQAYYCEQARDIYRSYVDAPRLYRTSEDGKKEFLTDEEMAATIASAEASMAEWCN